MLHDLGRNMAWNPVDNIVSVVCVRAENMDEAMRGVEAFAETIKEEWERVMRASGRLRRPTGLFIRYVSPVVVEEVDEA